MTCSGGKPTIEMISDEGMVVRMEVGKNAGFRMGRLGRLEDDITATVDEYGKVELSLGRSQSQSVLLFHEPGFASGMTVRSGELDEATVGLMAAAASEEEYFRFPETAQVVLWDGPKPVWHRRVTAGRGIDQFPEPVAAPQGSK